MPSVVGLTSEEAQKQIEEAKLKYEVDKEEYNKDVEEGHIISQDPEYSEKYHSVRQGSTVKVVISKGTEKAIVPKVTGMSQDDAIKALEDANLKAEVVSETSKKVQEGYVISQEVDESTEVAAGDTIKIHVSSGTGIKQITMASVIGKTEEQAKSELEGLGFKVSIGYEENTSKDNGIVLKQSLETGKVVDEGTTVTLTVNKLAELKTAKITVNVKSLLNGKVEYEETIAKNNSTTNATNGNTNSTTATEKKIKKVKLEVKVENDTIYSETVDPTSTNINVGTSKGTGVSNVKVYIDGVLKNQGQIKFSEANPSYIAE